MPMPPIQLLQDRVHDLAGASGDAARTHADGDGRRRVGAGLDISLELLPQLL
jgi:hypothetical protein